MKTKHLFLLSVLALTLFSCEYPYETEMQDFNIDFSYNITEKTVVFHGEYEKVAQDQMIINYAWDFGDGTIINEPGTNITQTHIYKDPGVYDVTFAVVWKNPKNITWAKQCTKTITISE